MFSSLRANICNPPEAFQGWPSAEWQLKEYFLKKRSLQELKPGDVLRRSVQLVGGFNPPENISQIGSFPQVGMKIKNIWNHHLIQVV